VSLSWKGFKERKEIGKEKGCPTAFSQIMDPNIFVQSVIWIFRARSDMNAKKRKMTIDPKHPLWFFLAILIAIILGYWIGRI
jgi:hypothetical protein